MDVFKTAITTLRLSDQPKTQLDILSNKQVILQIFKVSDIKNWEAEVKYGTDDELAIALFFHPAKLFNSDNFERFSYSELHSLSQKVDLGIDTYLLFTKSDFTHDEVMKMISKVLNTVYLFSSDDKFDFRVNAY